MICIQNNVFNSTNEEIINSISTCDSFNLYSPQQEVFRSAENESCQIKELPSLALLDKEPI